MKIFLIFLIFVSICHAETDSISIVAVGDIMLGRHVDDVIEKKALAKPKNIMLITDSADLVRERFLSPYELPFYKVEDILVQSDITFGNLECSLARNFLLEKPATEGYVFKANMNFGEGLRRAGFNVLSLANNHSMAGGRNSVPITAGILDREGITFAGMGEDIDKAREAKIVRIGKTRIAFIASVLIECSDFYAAGKNQPGIYVGDENSIIDVVKNARQISDIVVVSLHWGVERKFAPTQEQRTFARKLIEAGADLILGHHPHVIQGIERYNGKIIAYSLGNFVFDHLSDLSRSNRSMILKVFINKQTFEIEKLQVFPVMLKFNQIFPEPAEGDNKKEITDTLTEFINDLNEDKALFNMLEFK